MGLGGWMRHPVAMALLLTSAPLLLPFASAEHDSSDDSWLEPADTDAEVLAINMSVLELEPLGRTRALYEIESPEIGPVFTEGYGSNETFVQFIGLPNSTDAALYFPSTGEKLLTVVVRTSSDNLTGDIVAEFPKVDFYSYSVAYLEIKGGAKSYNWSVPAPPRTTLVGGGGDECSLIRCILDGPSPQSGHNGARQWDGEKWYYSQCVAFWSRATPSQIFQVRERTYSHTAPLLRAERLWDARLWVHDGNQWYVDQDVPGAWKIVLTVWGKRSAVAYDPVTYEVGAEWNTASKSRSWLCQGRESYDGFHFKYPEVGVRRMYENGNLLNAAPNENRDAVVKMSFGKHDREKEALFLGMEYASRLAVSYFSRSVWGVLGFAYSYAVDDNKSPPPYESATSYFHGKAHSDYVRQNYIYFSHGAMAADIKQYHYWYGGSKILDFYAAGHARTYNYYCPWAPGNCQYSDLSTRVELVRGVSIYVEGYLP